jgi:Rrf2 family protein
MRISAKAEYAARAVLYLSACYPRLATISEIADCHHIPLKYLEQILLVLKKAGIVESRRGVYGGYTLGRPPEKISVAEVIRAIDRRFSRSGCMEPALPASYVCPQRDACGLRQLWLRVQQTVERLLEETTFAELCAQNPVENLQHETPAGTGK